MRRMIWSVLPLLIFASPGILRAQTPACATWPSGFIPFAFVYSVSGIAGNNQLVIGSPGSGGYREIALRLPLPAAPDQMFCGTRVELAPGRFFDGVYVPTAQERVGDFSRSTDVAGRMITLYDPLVGTNQPFPGNIIPASRLDGTYAFRVRASLAPLGAPAIAEDGIGSATGDWGAAPESPRVRPLFKNQEWR